MITCALHDSSGAAVCCITTHVCRCYRQVMNVMRRLCSMTGCKSTCHEVTVSMTYIRD